MNNAFLFYTLPLSLVPDDSRMNEQCLLPLYPRHPRKILATIADSPAAAYKRGSEGDSTLTFGAPAGPEERPLVVPSVYRDLILELRGSVEVKSKGKGAQACVARADRMKIHHEWMCACHKPRAQLDLSISGAARSIDRYSRLAKGRTFDPLMYLYRNLSMTGIH